MKKLSLIIVCTLSIHASAQDPITVFQQFSGPYDFVTFGNTLNTVENGTGPCEILTSSSAQLQLSAGQEVVAAYLYWSGSGPGDFDVALNGTAVSAERTFAETIDGTRVFFSAFADVTAQVRAEGSTKYTLSELDLTAVIEDYCSSATNYGGWAVVTVYSDASLPLNQVVLFDGLIGVSDNNQAISILLDNLNVLDPTGAKIGFLAWEGDAGLAINETLRVNGDILSNPPLNPANNAFNGTNTFTNSSVLYNMDIDFYSIENGINPGDTSIAVNLTSSQDFVMVNNVVTVINNQLPDATITIDNIEGGTECGNLDIVVDYTVFNEISTEVLPANTPIAFYVETTPVGTAQTQNPVPIGGMESGTATLTIPDVFDGTFTLLAVVDDDGNGNSTVAEQNENNNTFGVELELMNIPNIPEPPNLETCDVLGTERFDLTEATQGIAPALEVTFYLTEEGANNGQGPIADVTDYLPGENPQTIFIRVENGTCFNTGSFTVQVIFCPLPDAAVSLPLDLAVCPGSDLEVEYTIHNTVNARGPLPAGTPVTIYIKNEPQLTVFTQTTLPVNSSGTGTAVLVLPDNLPIPFNLRAVADNDSAGNGTVAEFDESNNGFSVIVGTAPAPKIAALPDLLLCDTGFEKATFNLTQQLQIIDPQPDEVVQFFTSFSGAASNQGPIAAAALYENSSNPQPIFVRVENGFCFGVAEFNIATARCPITIPQGFSPNGDTVNDTFNIEGLTDIFLNFHLEIYSRNGNLIYEGGHKEGLWDGVPNKGLLVTEGKLVPTGTYYYALNLNDFDYPGPFTGWVYVNY